MLTVVKKAYFVLLPICCTVQTAIQCSHARYTCPSQMENVLYKTEGAWVLVLLSQRQLWGVVISPAPL